VGDRARARYRGGLREGPHDPSTLEKGERGQSCMQGRGRDAGRRMGQLRNRNGCFELPAAE
jgi:hypothetical protein